MRNINYQDEVDKILAKNSILKELNEIDAKLRTLSTKAGDNALMGTDPTVKETEEIAELVKQWRERVNAYSNL